MFKYKGALPEPDETFGDGLRIALLTNGLFPYHVGGMQKHSTNLAKHMSSAGINVDVYYIVDKRYPDLGIIRHELFYNEPRINLISVKCPKLPYFPGHHYPECFWKSLFYYRELRRRLSDIDFIYVQGYMGWGSLMVKHWFRKALPPIGVNFHGLEALQEKVSPIHLILNCFAPYLVRWNLKKADYVLSLGGRLDDLILDVGVACDRILHSFNGIDDSWIYNGDRKQKEDGVTRFLFVGRDTQRKGFTELNQALQHFLNNPKFEMHFVGPIAVERRITHPKVIYHGSISSEDDLMEVYRLSDVLICPSHSEGMPTVILEAMASKLAIIATDVGAVSEIVDETNGWLIPHKDPPSLLNVMNEALSCSKCDLIEKKDRSLSKVQNYIWEIMVKQTIQNIKSILV